MWCRATPPEGDILRSAQNKLHANRAQSQFTWVSSWPASLGGQSRNIATITLRQLLATLDIWTQSGTGVSRKPSESVFCGWFYDVREERRPGTDPQKSVTEFRFGGRGRGRPENIVQKPAQFSRFFRCLQIFQIFWSIVVSFLSYHLSRILRPVFGKTIEKHVSR